MLMAVGREAGCTSLEEIIEMPGLDYDVWSKWVFEGPSNVRTQMLLAQIIQMASTMGGGKAVKINKLLPYWDELTGENTIRAARAKKAKMLDMQRAFVNQLLDSKLPPPPPS